MAIMTPDGASAGYVGGDIWKGAGTTLRQQGPRIRSPLRFRGSPVGLQIPFFHLPLCPGLPSLKSSRAHTHRLVLVLQTTGGHIRHGRGRSWVSALRYLHRTIRNAAVRRSSKAGTTQAKRTGDRETSSLPLPGCAPEVQVERISGGRAPMARRPLGGTGEFPFRESRDPGTPVPATSCHFVPTAHIL